MKPDSPDAIHSFYATIIVVLSYRDCALAQKFKIFC
jgi:hypothetical protein